MQCAVTSPRVHRVCDRGTRDWLSCPAGNPCYWIMCHCAAT